MGSAMFDDESDGDDPFGVSTAKTKKAKAESVDNEKNEIANKPKEDTGELSKKIGIKIDVNKLKIGMGAPLTISQIKAQKAAKEKVSEIRQKLDVFDDGGAEDTTK